MSIVIDETGYYRVSWPCDHINEIVSSDIFGQSEVIAHDAKDNRIAMTTGTEIHPCPACLAEPIAEML